MFDGAYVSWRSWQKFPIVTSLALIMIALLTYGYLWRSGPVMAGDSGGYISVAQDISSMSMLRPQHRTPGMPLLIAITGLPPGRSFVWAQLLLHGIATVCGLFLLRACGMQALPILGFALLMWTPLYVQSSRIVMTETVAEAALLLTIGTWWLAVKKTKWWAAILSGFLACYAALSRPSYQLLPFILAILTVLASGLFIESSNKRAKFRRNSLLLLFAGTLPMLVISYINHARFGYFGLTYALGAHICNRTVLFVERLGVQWEPLRTALIEARNRALIEGKSHTALQFQWDHWRELRETTGLDDVRLSQKLFKANVELIRQNPLEYLIAVLRAVASQTMPYVTKVAGVDAVRHSLWVLLHFLGLGAWVLQLWAVGGTFVYLAATKGIGRVFERGTCCSAECVALYMVVFAVIVYTVLVNAAFDVGDPRQRSPVDMLMWLQTFLGFSLMQRWIRAGSEGGPVAGRDGLIQP